MLYFGRDNSQAVWLVWVVCEISVMIIFCRKENIQCFDHISLLKHLDGFITRPLDTSGQVRLGETGAAPGPRAIVADAK